MVFEEIELENCSTKFPIFEKFEQVITLWGWTTLLIKLDIE